MDLSIIAVNYNSLAFILPLLTSISKNMQGNSYEIIVVDNSSNDNSSHFIRQKFPNLCLIENKGNRGFARAANQGIRRSKGEYILVLNPDVQILPGSVEKAIGFLKGNPDVTLLLPKLLNLDGTLQFSCRTFHSFTTLLFRRTPLGKFFPNHRVIRKHLMMDWNHDEVREVDWGLGACMFVRRDAINGQDLFDERFFLYFEDIDLCFRLKQEDRKVVYFPGAVMLHTHVWESARGFFNRPKWELYKSLVKFYFKHGRLKPLIP